MSIFNTFICSTSYISIKKSTFPSLKSRPANVSGYTPRTATFNLHISGILVSMRRIYSLYNLHYPIKCQLTIITEKVLRKWKSSSTLIKHVGLHGAQWMPICNKTKLKLHPMAYALISACVQNGSMRMDSIFMRQVCNQVQEGEVSTLITACQHSKEQRCRLLMQLNVLRV